MTLHESAENFRLALVGVPNCGKTALFNRITGSRQKVANYPGVTIERKEGSFASADRSRQYQLIDLPGTYSLLPATLDEAITRDAITGKLRGEPPPDLILCVVAATNLRLSLRLVLELKQVGRPMIVALNMSDLAKQRGYKLDRARLEAELGVPVVETVAVQAHGARALLAAIDVLCATLDVERTASRAALHVAASGRAGSERRRAGTRTGTARTDLGRDRGDATRGATDPARFRLRRTVAHARTRAPRCGGHASGGRADPARGAAVCDLSGGFQLGHGADGVDQQRP